MLELVKGGVTKGSPSIGRGGRPIGCKVAKVEATAKKHKSHVMTNQRIVACVMAKANMRCVELMADYEGVSLFKTVLDASMA